MRTGPRSLAGMKAGDLDIGGGSLRRPLYEAGQEVSALSPNVKYLEAFVAVADLGSFRRAAERLNTTQPNISARIANLEGQLGLTLMERDAGSVRLTPKGRDLLEEARAVLRAMERFVAAAGDDSLQDGVLRLGVAEMIAQTWLRPYLLALKERFPNVVVELTVDLSATLTASLLRRDLDLALQNGPYFEELSGCIPLGHSPWVWVAAPGLGLSGLVEAQEMLRHPILTHSRQTRPYQQVADHFGRIAGPRPRLAPASNMAVVYQMTLDGLGLSCLPEALARRALADGRLVQIDYGWRPEDLRFDARFDRGTAPAYVVKAAEMAAIVSPRDAPTTTPSLSGESV